MQVAATQAMLGIVEARRRSRQYAAAAKHPRF